MVSRGYPEDIHSRCLKLVQNCDTSVAWTSIGRHDIQLWSQRDIRLIFAMDDRIQYKVVTLGSPSVVYMPL